MKNIMFGVCIGILLQGFTSCENFIFAAGGFLFAAIVMGKERV